MSTAGKIEMILALSVDAFKKGVQGAKTAIGDMAVKTKSALGDSATQFKSNISAAKQYNEELRNQGGILDTLRGKVAALVGAYLGFQAIAGVKDILMDADNAAFRLEASLRAANREFNNIGDARSWGDAIESLSQKLKIYSKTDLKEAAAATIDMTKRLGFSEEQMALLIERTADLSSGKTDLQGGIERVTAAMRGEAEASEYLGLTLNENYVKAWYEAHGAHEKAWKDLTDLEKAQVRFNVFLEQAGPYAGKAADSITTLSGAYALAKKEINDAINENENATEAMKGLAKVVADNADELGNLVAIIIDGAARMLNWVIANKEVVSTIGLLVFGIGALSGLVSRLSVIWGGLSTIMRSTMAMRIIGWLGEIGVALKGVQLAALSTAGAIGAVSGATLAFVGGYAIGAKIDEWEYLHDVVNANKKALDEVPEKFAAITKATGVSIKSFDDLDEAQKKGLIRFNDVTGAWEKVANAGKKAAQETGAANIEATDEMKKAYKSYAELVIKLNDSIAGKQRSLTEQLREMSRSGMSDLDAWKDRKAEAEEFAKAAKLAAKEAEKAFAAGDAKTGQKKMEESVELWGKAREAAADLNTEVKDGDKILQTKQKSLKIAKEMVEEYGRAEIETEKKFKQAIEDTARALDNQTGGKLSEEMPELSKAFGELKVQADDLGKKSAEFNQQWNQVWDDFLASGSENIYELDTKLSQLTKDRTVKVYIEEIEKHAKGGLIGYMRGGVIQALAAGGSVVRNILGGGSLPGFGGGDRRLLLGEDGEVMLNKFAVKEGGLRAALAFNSGQWGVVISELLKRTRSNLSSLQGYMDGGIIGRVMQPIQALAGGGVVESSAPGVLRHEHVIRIGNSAQATVYSDDVNAERLIAALRHAQEFSS